MSDIYIDRESVTTQREGSPDVVAFGRPVLTYVHFDPTKKLVDKRPDRPPWIPEVIYHRHGWILYVPPGVLKQCPDLDGLENYPDLAAMAQADWAEMGDDDEWEHWTDVLDADAVDEAYRVALAFLGKYSKPPTLKSVRGKDPA